MTAGEKIRKYRELCKITQQELADSCEINVATIKKYELGQRNPKSEQLEKIAKGLGVNPIIFYDLELNSVGDVMSLLFLISEVTHLDIVSPDYVRYGLFLKFADKGLMDKIDEWNKLSEALDDLRNNNAVQDNDEIKNVVAKKIIEMESEFRLNAIKDNTVLLKKKERKHPPLLLPYFTPDDFK